MITDAGKRLTTIKTSSQARFNQIQGSDINIDIGAKVEVCSSDVQLFAHLKCSKSDWDQSEEEKRTQITETLQRQGLDRRSLSIS